MPRVDAGDLQLTREGGFPPGLIKAVLERGLTAELTEHLGYEKGDPAGRGSPNSHNGTTPKTVATEVGDIGLDTPRDRAGTFEPRLVPKGARKAGACVGHRPRCGLLEVEGDDRAHHEVTIGRVAAGRGVLVGISGGNDGHVARERSVSGHGYRWT